MKIIIATPLYPPAIGGPATYAKILAKELPPVGFETVMIDFSQTKFLPKIIRHLVYAWRIYRVAWSADIIYALDPVSVGLPSVLAAKLSRRPLVLKIVGDHAWEQGIQRFGVTDLLDDFYRPGSNHGRRVKWLKMIQTWVANKANQIIVPSHYLADIVARWGVDDNKINVIYNAFESIDNKIVAREMTDNKNPVIISAGRLVPWKGFSGLIDTVFELLSDYPNLKLFIFGDGPERPVLEDKIRQYNLSAKVILRGQVSKGELARQASYADAFVLNTAYEGFSHVLLEMMAWRVPIITTTVGGNPELIEDGIDGLLVPYNNKTALTGALQKIISDPELRKSLIMAGHKRVSEFKVDKMISRLLKVLSKT